MSDRGDILLDIRGLELQRRTQVGSVALLRGLDLRLRRGEWVALLGGNGSGKTSLLRWLAGPASPVHGRTALVFQDPDDAFVAATVGEELCLGRGEDERAALEAAWRLQGLAARDPRTLSAGQKQRLAVALALAGSPALLLCDEPTTLQDEEGAVWLRNRLRRWREQTGGALLWATQSREEMLLADRAVLLAHGEAVASGPPAGLLALREVQDLLGPPPYAAAGSAAPAPPAQEPATQRATRPAAEWRGVGCRWGPPGGGFRGVDLAIAPGERLGLCGPSGCGKSTLLAAAVGLRRPDAGTCLLAGRPLYRRGAPDLGHGLALLAPQFPELLFTRATVEAEAALDPGLGPGGIAGLLRAAGLPAAAAARNPHDLSSGERRRLAVALVVQSGRPLLLLDEPTAGLDRAARLRLIELLAPGPAGAAVVIASHDEAFLAACGCRVLRLDPDGLAPARGGGGECALATPRRIC